VRFHHWGLGFRQSSFRPIARVSRDGTVSVFGWLPLFWHAVVPSGFHLQVSPMTQEHPSEFLLTASGIQLRVPRRTISRIQLSDRTLRSLRSRTGYRPKLAELHQSQVLVQVAARVACVARPRPLVLRT